MHVQPGAARGQRDMFRSCWSHQTSVTRDRRRQRQVDIHRDLEVLGPKASSSDSTPNTKAALLIFFIFSLKNSTRMSNNDLLFLRH